MKTYNWTQTRGNVRKLFNAEIEAGNIEADDTVWADDAGVYYVDSGNFAGVDMSELPDMREVGKVADYLD